MLQTAFIRENKEQVIKALAKRHIDATATVTRIIELDEKRRSTQVELDTVLAESNLLSKDIGAMMKSGEKAKAEILKAKTVQLRDRSKELSLISEEVAAELQQELYTLPNSNSA